MSNELIRKTDVLDLLNDFYSDLCGKTTSFIRCPKCGAQGQKFEISTVYAADNEAVAAWNRREY